MLAERYERSIEDKWQRYWAERNIYAFNGINDPRPIYSIDTPPPFTSGELHMGHVLSYSYFDFVARYKRMRGFNVYYPQGWDTQGFPTEVRVERKYGRLQPEQFRKKCEEWTKEMIGRMKRQMTEMGFSPDWRYEYRTMDRDYHRKVQLSLIEMYRKGLIYRGEYPVFWCPKCNSAIAKAELDEIEKTGVLNYLTFTGPEGEDLLIATTRPELLPACVAVLYNPEDERYKYLEGKKVKTPLGKEVPVFADENVEKEFGTGLLMVCTFGDKMDVIWFHKYKLPLLQVIDRHGKMINTAEWGLDGLSVTDAREQIIRLLEKKAAVAKKEPLKQMVKVHDRCGTIVELLPSMQWFADIKSTGKAIKEMARQVKWVPDFGITYLIDWVEGAEWDWVISRQRIFGTPLPFYYCEKCNSTAAADVTELPFYAENAKPKKCTCGAQMKPETSTCDCWVDSSITPLIIAGWPDDKEMMAKLYPSSLRPQGVEIVRTWAFYTIHRSGVCLTGTKPWEVILLNGNVLAPDGKKMSKSLGNIISPENLRKDYPTDAIRQWAAMSGALAKDRPFSYEDIHRAKAFLTKLWNAARLVSLSTKGYDGDKPASLGIIDRWMITKMNMLIKEFTQHMEAFEFHHAITKLHNFFWHDFCDNYLEYVKHRIYGKDENSRKAAQYVLHRVLYDSIKLLAPISPHITEEIYNELFGAPEGESIHLAKWPTEGKCDESVLGPMATFNAIVSAVRQHKARNRLPQNAELQHVSIILPEGLPSELIDELKAISKIKEIKLARGEFSVVF